MAIFIYITLSVRKNALQRNLLNIIQFMIVSYPHATPSRVRNIPTDTQFCDTFTGVATLNARLDAYSLYVLSVIYGLYNESSEERRRLVVD